MWPNTGDPDIYKEIRQEVAPEVVVIAPVPVQDDVLITEPTPEPTPEPIDSGIRSPDREIDFETLFKRNPDTLGWINVPGTIIDYPFVGSRDNTDYLLRDIGGNKSDFGTIFMDMGNSSDFSDRNIVIYGHNMNNGTMFAGLHKFSDIEFFDENREIKIYTPAGMRVYEIFAAYVTDDDNILYQTDFSDDMVWESYVNKIFRNKDLSANLMQIQIGGDDQIVTLSTCVRGEGDRRYLVQGILKRDGC